MTHIKISPIDTDSYVATSEKGCRNDKEQEAFRMAKVCGLVISHGVLAVRMSN